MADILVIGGGFAGVKVLQILGRAGLGNRTTLVDQRDRFEFLPLLPDVLGLRLRPEVMSIPFSRLSGRYGFSFQQDRIHEVDIHRREARGAEETFTWKYLVLAHGAVTSFHGNENARRRALRLRYLAHILELQKALSDSRTAALVIAGGGYTGVEAASQAVRFAEKTGRNLQVSILEINDTILHARPQWMQRYMQERLQRMGVRIVTGTTVHQIDGRRVVLSDGTEIQDAVVLWSAGVNVPDLIPGANSDRKGRVVTDSCLRVAPGCYVLGDAAHFGKEDEKPLFMTAGLSLQQGKYAARSIRRELRGRPVKPYRPRYLGFLIPLADGTGAGRILGINVKGAPVSMLHHLVSFTRNFGPGTRRPYLADLLREGIRM